MKIKRIDVKICFRHTKLVSEPEIAAYELQGLVYEHNKISTYNYIRVKKIKEFNFKEFSFHFTSIAFLLEFPFYIFVFYFLYHFISKMSALQQLL